MTSPVIIVIRRFSRSAIAPASGPNSSAGSSVAIQTPLTAALCAAVAPITLACPVCFPVSVAASTVSATMLSQSPRLDSDSAIHSRRNGRMESTPRRALPGWDRMFTATAYRSPRRSGTLTRP